MTSEFKESQSDSEKKKRHKVVTLAEKIKILGKLHGSIFISCTGYVGPFICVCLKKNMYLVINGRLYMATFM
jgi:hypothetical protein